MKMGEIKGIEVPCTSLDCFDGLIQTEKTCLNINICQQLTDSLLMIGLPSGL